MGPKKLQRIAYKLNKLGIPFLPKCINVFNNILFSCDLNYEMYIPKTTLFYHSGLGVVIHKDTVLGEGNVILQHVTIGGAPKEGEKGAPRLGDHILVGAGACILGPIKIGNNVKIGANAVVLKDIPDHSTAVGVPAQIIMK